MKESTIIKSKEHEVKLLACDDGIIRVKFPDNTYILEDRNLVYISDRAFLSLCAIEGTRINFLLPLKLNEERLARDFLDYWGEKRSKELKNIKWLGFLGYWKHVLDFISKNVDIELCKPTYRTVYYDHKDTDGSEGTNIEVLMSWGVSWQDDFDKSWELTERLVDEQIDRDIDGLDGYRWYRNLMVQFRPIAGNVEDFVKFDYKEVENDY